MKKQSVVEAYASIKPDDEARTRMLRNIQLSSEISPVGKDERKMRKNMRPVMIAAIISLMILLMGSAIVVMNLQEWKVGEVVSGKGDILDSEGNVLIKKDTHLDLISLHGFTDMPTYLAHKEWFDFLKTYDPNLEILSESDDYIRPEEYEAYGVYSQEMEDKVDEIAEKYGLNLLGPCAYFQRSEKKTFHECLKIQSLLISEAEADITKMSGYFYEAGNFKVEFDMEMLDQENDWPYTMHNTIYYSRKDNFDVVYLNVGNIELWDQWTYTTSEGMEVLIVSYDYGAIVFCDKEDSVIFAQVNNHFETDYNTETGQFERNIVMTREQLEQVVDQIDFSLEVESVNMSLAREQLEQFQNK